MKMRILPDKYNKGTFAIYDWAGDHIGSFNTPKLARHKARMWYMWLTTGDHAYLRKEQYEA